MLHLHVNVMLTRQFLYNEMKSLNISCDLCRRLFSGTKIAIKIRLAKKNSEKNAFSLIFYNNNARNFVFGLVCKDIIRVYKRK